MMSSESLIRKLRFFNISVNCCIFIFMLLFFFKSLLAVILVWWCLGLNFSSMTLTASILLLKSNGGKCLVFMWLKKIFFFVHSIFPKWALVGRGWHGQGRNNGRTEIANHLIWWERPASVSHTEALPGCVTSPEDGMQ